MNVAHAIARDVVADASDVGRDMEGTGTGSLPTREISSGEAELREILGGWVDQDLVG